MSHKKIEYEVGRHPGLHAGKLVFRSGNIEDEVPSEICERGKEAVQQYAEQEIARVLAKRKRFRDFGKNLNTPISVQHRGILLEGRIVGASSEYVIAELDKPEEYKGRRLMNYGWASAVAGHRVFERDDEPKLSRNAIESGQRLLTWIYDEGKFKEDHRSAIELAKDLNQ